MDRKLKSVDVRPGDVNWEDGSVCDEVKIMRGHRVIITWVDPDGEVPSEQTNHWDDDYIKVNRAL